MTDRCEYSGGKTIIILLFVAVLARVIIFLGSPLFVSTSDSGSWISFALEIDKNHLLIPANNVINYPGSTYVYAPVVPYLLSFIMKITGIHGIAPFYAITVLEITIGSLTIIPVYLITRERLGVKPALFSGSVYASFSPFLYLISFSALPQEAGFLLMLWTVYFLERTHTSGRLKIYTVSTLFLLSFALNFLHDLTAFFFLLVISLYLLYMLARKILFHERWRGLTNGPLWSFLGSLSGFLLWYAPRFRWLIQGISFYGGRTGTVSLLYTITADLGDLSQPLGIPAFLSFISPIFFILSIPLIIITLHYHEERTRPAAFFFIASLFIDLASMPFPVIFSRLSYFLALFYAVFSGYIVTLLNHRGDINIGGRVKWILTLMIRRKGSIYRIVVLFIILYSIWGVVFSYYAHTYYLSENDTSFSDICGISEFILLHERRNDVIAADGGTGYFIMGYTGNPVIDYVNQSFLTQDIQINESKAALILTEEPYLNTTLTSAVMEEYNVSLVITTHALTHIPAFYRELYQYGDLILYSV